MPKNKQTLPALRCSGVVRKAEMTLEQWVSAPISHAVAYFAEKTGIDAERQRKLSRILQAARQHERKPPNDKAQPRPSA